MIFVPDYRNLYLDCDFGNVGFVFLFGVENGCCGLSAVDNLEIIELGDILAGVIQLDVISSRSNTIVIGEKHIRSITDCLTHSFIDVSTELEKGTDILLK